MNRVWVKICANTSLEDAQHAIRAGADAVGFVFARKSKRRVTPDQVAAITSRLPAHAEKIGVFVEQELQETMEIVRAAGLTGVQMHAPSIEQAAELAVLLREGLNDLPRRPRILQTLHFNAAEPDRFNDGLRFLAGVPAIDGVLIDSGDNEAPGGTGVVFDWDAARQTLLQAETLTRIVVAGGLTPANVHHAIHMLGPWGVDVATGVEATAGVKDPHKVEGFIAAARHATAEATKTIAPS